MEKQTPVTIPHATLGDLKADGRGLRMECYQGCPSEALDLDRLIEHFGEGKRWKALRRRCPNDPAHATGLYIEWHMDDESRKAARA